MPSESARQIAVRLRGEQDDLLAGTEREGSPCRSHLKSNPAALRGLLRLHLDALALALTAGDDALFMANVRWVAPTLQSRGVDPSDVVRCLQQLADMVRERFSSEESRVLVPLIEQAAGTYAPGENPQWRLFLEALLSGNLPRAQAVAESGLKNGYAYVYERVIQPALEEVGELWLAGRLSVADEHLATAQARTVVATLIPGIIWRDSGPLALLTCAEGELHELGAQLMADLLALQGWQVVNYGANTPGEDLVDQAKRLSPAVVGISVGFDGNLPSCQRLIARLRQEVPEARIVVGGQAFKSGLHDGLSLGADATARTASGALDLLGEWSQEVTPQTPNGLHLGTAFPGDDRA